MNFGIKVSLAFLVGDGIAGQTFSRCTLEHLKQYRALQAMGVGVLGFALEASPQQFPG